MNFNYNIAAGDVVSFGLSSESKSKRNGSKSEEQLFESASEGSVSGLGEMQIRSMAMGALLTWVDEEDYSYNALDELVIGVADIDGDSELTEEEEGIYQDIWEAMADAMLSIGGASANVDEAINDEDDAACAKLGKALSSYLDKITADDDEIVSGFAQGNDGMVLESINDDRDEYGKDMVLEAAFKKVKVVRNGKVVVKKKRVSGKVRLSAAQKKGLKKARRKANTGAAKLKRRKAMKIRKKRGM